MWAIKISILLYVSHKRGNVLSTTLWKMSSSPLIFIPF